MPGDPAGYTSGQDMGREMGPWINYSCCNELVACQTGNELIFSNHCCRLCVAGVSPHTRKGEEDDEHPCDGTVLFTQGGCSCVQ